MSDRSALKPSFCRLCYNACPILVDVHDGAAVRVIGDAQGPIHHGYTCVKGRAQPSFLRDPGRILHPQRRRPDGGFRRIDSAQALDEIATSLRDIVERHGPRAVALYTGTNVGMTVPGGPFASAFMNALGSPMKFTSITIDKPGRMIAEALHGTWGVPDQGMEDPEVIFFLGVNPVLTYTGLPTGNPRKWLDAAIAGGTRLIVVDPRRSDTARRAFVHLQARPGFDAAIIAAVLRTVIDEGLHDAEFVAENVQGFEALTEALQPFAVEWVAQLADVDPDELRLAARTIGRARRGWSMAGTGPSMAGPNTLIDYLLLSLETICGRRMRAGQVLPNPGALLRRPTPRAQASPPRPGYGFGEHMRVRGLTNTAAGMPTGALAEEMLVEGEGRVRALICLSGNPVIAWPDQLQTLEALSTLELYVQIEPWWSQSARLATHVLPPPMPLEVPSATVWMDVMSTMGGGYGLEVPLAQYTAAIVDPPPGADLVEEWQVFFRLAQRMGLQLRVGRPLSDDPDDTIAVGMASEPSTDELLDLLSRGGRVTLDEVRRHPHGAVFADPRVVVQPKQPGWTGRLDVGNAAMLADLASVAGSLRRPAAGGGDADPFPYRLVVRRDNHTYNTSCHHPATNGRVAYNPAFMHPDDLRGLGLRDGDDVELSSQRSAIPAVVAADGTLRRGVVSMVFGYGGPPAVDGAVRSVGSSPARLLVSDVDYEPYSGQPRMSNVAVQVTRRS